MRFCDERKTDKPNTGASIIDCDGICIYFPPRSFSGASGVVSPYNDVKRKSSNGLAGFSGKRMKKRGGNLSDKGTASLDTDLIRASKECIEYVVTRELCHLKYRNHSPVFYQLLDAAIPGWEKIKHKLEANMV